MAKLDFWNTPLEKLLNTRNAFSRLDDLENREIEPSLTAYQLSEITPDGGSITVENITNIYNETIATPGGDDTNVQYNNAGAFGGSTDFTWNDTTKTLTIGKAGDDVGWIRGTGLLGISAADGDVDNGYEFGALGGNAKASSGGEGGDAGIYGGGGDGSGKGGYSYNYGGPGGDTGDGGTAITSGGQAGASGGVGGKGEVSGGSSPTASGGYGAVMGGSGVQGGAAVVKGGFATGTNPGDAAGNVYLSPGEYTSGGDPGYVRAGFWTEGGGNANYTQWDNNGVQTFVGDARLVMRLARRTITATDTATADDCVIICNKATAMTVNLPAATGSDADLIIKSIGAGAVTVDANGSETIDGETTQTLSQYDSIHIKDIASGVWVIL